MTSARSPSARSSVDRRGILVIGDVINDVIVRPTGPTAVDTDTPAEVTAVPGGSGANQAAWLAALGLPARLAARVGAADAATHRQVLADGGVDARLGVDTELPTGSIVVLVSDDGARSMYTDRGANRRLRAEDLGAALLDGIGHVHVSGYALINPGARGPVRTLWQAAAEAGLGTSVDAASAAFLAEAGDAFLEWTEGVDLVFSNLAEGRILTGTSDPSDVAGHLLDHFSVVALKLGALGTIVTSRSPSAPGTPSAVTGTPPDTPVVDPTGAGDAFCAGFLARWVDGGDLAACTASATAAAASALDQVGGRPPTPDGPHAPPRPAAPPWEELRRRAGRVAANAYAPWSGLRVGAAGLTDDGRVLAACNVENASLGLTLCAECGLVSALRAAGATGLVAVSVVAADGRPLPPCGRCRQVLLDNGGPATLVDAGAGRDPIPLGALLPGPFDTAGLESRRQR